MDIQYCDGCGDVIQGGTPAQQQGFKFYCSKCREKETGSAALPKSEPSANDFDLFSQETIARRKEAPRRTSTRLQLVETESGTLPLDRPAPEPQGARPTSPAPAPSVPSSSATEVGLLTTLPGIPLNPGAESAPPPAAVTTPLAEPDAMHTRVSIPLQSTSVPLQSAASAAQAATAQAATAQAATEASTHSGSVAIAVAPSRRETPAPSVETTADGRWKVTCRQCDGQLAVKPVQNRCRTKCPRCSATLVLSPDGDVNVCQEPVVESRVPTKQAAQARQAPQTAKPSSPGIPLAPPVPKPSSPSIPLAAPATRQSSQSIPMAAAPATRQSSHEIPLAAPARKSSVNIPTTPPGVQESRAQTSPAGVSSGQIPLQKKSGTHSVRLPETRELPKSSPSLDGAVTGAIAAPKVPGAPTAEVGTSVSALLGPSTAAPRRRTAPKGLPAENVVLWLLIGALPSFIGVALTLFLGDPEATRLLQALGDAVMEGIGTLRNLVGF